MKSLLEQRIWRFLLKSYQYQCGGMLTTAIETLLNNKEAEKSFIFGIAALPGFLEIVKIHFLLAKIYFELKEIEIC